MNVTAKCSIPDCDRPLYCKGYCQRHYRRSWQHGDPHFVTETRATCSVEGCGRKHTAKGYCYRHYTRFTKTGDPMGGVRAFRGDPLRFIQEKALPHQGDDCISWPFSRNTSGYGQYWHNGRLRIVSRYICELAHGDPPTPHHDSSHSCGNGHLGCVNPHHLSWKTKSENMADKLIHGTHHRGERSPISVLTENDVREIRALKGKMPYRQIAKIYKTSGSNVSTIMARKSWFWLED